jgi:prevent-host-death family protein
MPRIVNVHEAKTKLSELVAEVEAGAEVVLARSGKPVARLVPMVIEAVDVP